MDKFYYYDEACDIDSEMLDYITKLMTPKSKEVLQKEKEDKENYDRLKPIIDKISVALSECENLNVKILINPDIIDLISEVERCSVRGDGQCKLFGVPFISCCDVQEFEIVRK